MKQRSAESLIKILIIARPEQLHAHTYTMERECIIHKTENSDRDTPIVPNVNLKGRVRICWFDKVTVNAILVI